MNLKLLKWLPMLAGVAGGTTACKDPVAPVDEIEYVVNSDNPKTTPVQKEINKMLNVLGIFPATLQKTIVERDGVITSASYKDEYAGYYCDSKLNKELSNENETVYDIENRPISEPERIAFYSRKVYTKTSDGLLCEYQTKKIL